MNNKFDGLTISLMALLSYYTPLASSIMGDMIGLTNKNIGREAHQTCMK